jgi:hypothetical protein
MTVKSRKGVARTGATHNGRCITTLYIVAHGFKVYYDDAQALKRDALFGVLA